MTSITAVNNGFLFDKKILFGSSQPDASYIQLATIMGEDMRYQKLEYILIDYPGEYDINETSIQCFLGQNNLLNYLIIYDDKKFAILQSSDILENTTDFAVAKEWFYTDDSVLAKLEQLEVEGEKTKLLNEIL